MKRHTPANGNGAIRYHLGERTAARLLHLADQVEDGWWGIAAITAEMLERESNGGSPRMLVYEAIGQAARGRSKSTIRQYDYLRRMIGDDLHVEFPQFGYDAWRVIVRYSRISGKSVTDVAVRCANGSDITADALAAKLAGKLDAPDPHGRAVARLEQAAKSLLKHAPNSDARDAAMILAASIEDYAKRFGAEDDTSV